MGVIILNWFKYELFVNITLVLPEVLSLNDFINHKTAKYTVKKQFTNKKVWAINVNNILNLR